tara:strand:+ start:70 stop:657 length:588 start_codon:yes stop_codon:yes gene_type:complete
MSTLAVNQITTQTGNTITLPTGKKIVATDGGSIVSPGAVLQTLSMTLTSATSAQGNSYADSGLTLDITPSSTSSKILVTGFVNVAENYFRSYIRVVRNGTALSVGDAAGSRPQVYSSSTTTSGWDVYDISPIPINILDSPNTTSQVTYKIQYKDYQGTANSSGAIAYINRSHSDRNTGNYDPRTVSVLTVQEIAG